MIEVETPLQSAIADLQHRTVALDALDPAPLQQALDTLAEAAAAAGLLGLQDCALLLQQNIGDAIESAPLSADQLAIIHAWPGRIEDYLHSGCNAAASEALIDSLKQTCWPSPLTDMDTEVLREMLTVTATDEAAVVDTELVALSQVIGAIDDDEPDTLRQTAKALERFAEVLDGTTQLGLQDCTLLLQQNLEDIVATGEALTDPQKILLVAWSGLVRNSLNRPADPAPRYGLVRNLSHPHWPAALTAGDAGVLYDLFGLEPPADGDPLSMTGILATANPAAGDGTATAAQTAAASGDPLALANVAASFARLESDNPATVTELAAQLAELANTAAALDRVGLQDVCLLLKQRLEDLMASNTGLDQAQIAKIQQWIEHMRTYLVAADNRAAADGMLECITDDCWPNPLDDVDIPLLREMLTGEPAAQPAATAATPGPMPTAAAATEVEADSVSPGTPLQEAMPTAETATEVESTTAPAGDEAFQAEAVSARLHTAPQPVSQDLIDMLIAEVVQLRDEVQQLPARLQAADITEVLQRDSLSQFANRIERFTGAAQAAELTGLQQACGAFQTMVQDLAEQQVPLSEHQCNQLRDWPEKMAQYLARPGETAASRALAELLLDDCWVRPLTPAQAQVVIEQLAAVYVSDAVVSESRLQIATAEHVSLALPDDINQALLEGLLQELPVQTEHFSEAIQALANGRGNRHDLERAQRVAHTIKGAANTVGVRGIAALTHQIEDLLEILVEHDRMPSPNLATVLIEAADCLEEMSENLQAQRQEAPAGAIQTLQAVLDWVNRLECDGIEAMHAEPPVPASATDQMAPVSDTAPDRSAPVEEEEQTRVPLLRIPAALIDDLLRMVGETLILTAQLQEKVRQSTQQSQSLLKQHELLRQLVGELEQQVDVGGIAYKLAESAASGEFDTLELEQYNELHTVTHRLVEASVDSQELDQDIGQYLRSLDELLINQSRLQREVQDLVMRTRMVPIKTIVPRLQRAVRQTCRVTGKQADLILEGTDTLLDSDVLNALVDPLMHMLRNAIDHGIETHEQRIHHGKPASGTISLHCNREGAQVVIHCRDDGAGLDAAAIRQVAEQRGLIETGQELSDAELHRLILQPGFSTRKATTQTSGRGIGMDIVVSQLQAIKGSILIASTPGQGTEFELRVPISLMTTHGLLVRLRKQVMAVSTRGLIRILHPADGELVEQNGEQHYRLDDDELDLYQIDDLLRLPKDRRSGERRSRPGLLIREEALNCVVQVEQVIDSRDLVVKPLGPYLKKIRGIVGATILGDGSVVPVLDLPELIRTPHDGLIDQAELTDTGIHRSLPVALIVDDSISARRTLAQIVRDAGYDIRTAKDGLEAAGLMEKKRPDIVLTDLEMPRMNGFELTSHIRANERTATIPIIMVTSRSTEKHRQLAYSTGIDVYLTKPFTEDELLQHIHDLLEQSYSTID